MLDISFANEVFETPVENSSMVLRDENVFLHYSYRNASTGSSFAAFLAGYKPKRMQMAIPKITATIAHDHEKMGTTVARSTSCA